MKKFEPKNTNGVADLISLLEELNRQKLEIMDEGSAKAKIWSKIEPHVRATSRAELNVLADEVHRVPVLRPSLIKQAQIKEVVMEYIETVHAGARFFFGKRFVAAAATLTVLFFALVPNSGFFPAVSAEKNTYLSVEQGEVQILRGDNVIAVDGDRVLAQGDTVVVGDGSLAQIYFLDDSRAAFGPGSEVFMQKLYLDEENGSNTQVEVVLNSGKAWVQVLNLFGGEDYFSVFAGGGEFTIDRAGESNIEIFEDKTVVQVASNLISFSIPFEESYKDGILGEGTQITVNGELIIESTPDMSQDIWWNYNLIQGENHVEEVVDYYITESADKVRLMPGDPLRDLKEFKEAVTDVVSFDSKLEKSLDEADSRLAEAEQLLSEGEEEEAQEKLSAYIEIVEEVMSDEGVSDEDLEAVEAQIDEATKALTVKVADNEDLSAVQEAVDQADEIVTEDKAITKVDNASNKLTLALSLVDEGSYELAFDYLRGYGDEVLNAVNNISNVPANERASVVSMILDKKIENLQILKIINEKLKDDPELAEEVDEVKAQTLFEINTLVISLKERAITKLNDFLSEVQSDESIQIQVLSNLKKSVPLDLDIMEKINDIEEVYFDEGEVVFLLR